MTPKRSSLRRLAMMALLATLAPSLHAQSKVTHVGVLVFSAPASEPNLTALMAGLRELGYAEGRNVAFQFASANGQPERLRDLAAQLVAGNPDLIVVLGGDVVPFVKEATSTIPIVMLTSNDPVAAGLVASFARPAGNITGVAFVSAETGAKRLQFLKEAAPSLTRIAVLWNPDHPDGEFRDISAAARQLGVETVSLEVRAPGEFDAAFASATRARVDALMVVSSRLMNANRTRILEFASKQRIPLASGWGEWATAGGFLSYGPDLDTLAKRAAIYVDKIVKGAKPGDLAVELPTRFALVLNLQTAKQLGITVPSSLLARADRVIE